MAAVVGEAAAGDPAGAADAPAVAHGPAAAAGRVAGRQCPDQVLGPEEVPVRVADRHPDRALGPGVPRVQA